MTPSAAPSDRTPAELPGLAATRALRTPAQAVRTLPSGLQVLAVRRASVPLVEVRLRIPFAGRSGAHPARSALLAATMLLGTADRDELALVQALQEVGSELSVSSDADRVVLGTAVLRPGLPALLDLLAEVLTAASYPADPVAGERDRMVEHLQIARSQPAVMAREARAALLYPGHPYGQPMPAVADVADVTAAQLRRLHRDRIAPAGATLVLVGDLSPKRTLDLVERHLGAWSGRASGPVALPGVPASRPAAGGPVHLVDRPGSVQSTIRIGGPAVTRADPGYAAMQLTSLVFGGYFSSRFVANVREDKGYSYSPRSSLDQRQLAAAFLVDADVATEVTAAALVETRYELARMAVAPVGEGELEDARQYALGTLALSISTQAGLAATLAALAGMGLGPEWIAAQRRALSAVTVADVAEQARTYLAPTALVTVVVGDTAEVEASLARVTDVVRA